MPRFDLSTSPSSLSSPLFASPNFASPDSNNNFTNSYSKINSTGGSNTSFSLQDLSLQIQSPTYFSSTPTAAASHSGGQRSSNNKSSRGDYNSNNNTSNSGIISSRSNTSNNRRKSVSSSSNNIQPNFCCSSPDGSGLYTLSWVKTNSSGAKQYFMEYESLLSISTYTDGEEQQRDKKSRCVLPMKVQSALEITPPMELVCVEADSPNSSTTTSSSSTRRDRNYTTESSGERQVDKSMMLCIYTRKNIFLVEVQFYSSSSSSSSYLTHTNQDTNDTTTTALVEAGSRRGEIVLSANEIFESYLLSVPSTTNIIKVRPAPQRRMGYTTLCPRGSLAMVTNDPTTNQHTLVLLHTSQDGNRPQQNHITTTPLHFGFEKLATAEQEEQSIVDFSFAQSNDNGGLSLLSAMTVLLLKGNGEVLFASPILFDGTVVPRAALKEAMEYFHEEMQYIEHECTASGGDYLSDAKWKQFRVAQQYFKDVFGVEASTGNNHFVTARLHSTRQEQNAAIFPVKLQGPILLPSPTSTYTSTAIAIENFYVPELVGFATVINNGGVNDSSQTIDMDFGMVSPNTLLPRFDFESREDGYALDEELFPVQAIHHLVLRSDQDLDDEDGTTYKQQLINPDSLVLLRDPVMDTILHLLSPVGVTTISTNVMRVTFSKIREQVKENIDDTNAGRYFSSPPGNNRRGGSDTNGQPIRTAVWSSLNVASSSLSSSATANAELLGAVVVYGDSRHGTHMLVGKLSDGSTVPINVSESRCLHEVFHGGKNNEQKRLAITAGTIGAGGAIVPRDDEALKMLQSIPPLYEVVEPIIKKVKTGLGSMGKLVVSKRIEPKDITPDMLAVAMRIKERCDKDVILPLLELKQHIDARREHLLQMRKSQHDQLEQLKELIENLKIQKKSIDLKMELAQSNSEALSNRSEAILQASQDLLPKLTQAEHDYFEQLRLLERKCSVWEEQFHRIDSRVSNTCDALLNSNGSPNVKRNGNIISSNKGKLQLGLTEEDKKQCHDLLDGQKEKLNCISDRLVKVEQKTKDIGRYCGLRLSSSFSSTPTSAASRTGVMKPSGSVTTTGGVMMNNSLDINRSGGNNNNNYFFSHPSSGGTPQSQYRFED